MSSTTDLLIKGLAKTLVETPEKKSSPYDTQAEVRRVEGDIAWVHIPGGVDETPVQLTTNAKKGDIVQVRVSGGRAWLYGNQTAPPTDDTKANEVDDTLKATVVEIDRIIEHVREIDRLVAQSITVDQLEAGEISAVLIEAINLAVSGTIDAERLNVDQLVANQAFITALNTAVINSGAITTNMLNAGVVSAAIVNAINMSTSTIYASRIVYTDPETGESYLIQPTDIYIIADPQPTSETWNNGEGFYIRTGTEPNYVYTEQTGQTYDSTQTYYVITTVEYQKVNANLLEDLTITADKIVGGAISADKLNIGQYIVFDYRKKAIASKPTNWETDWTLYYRTNTAGHEDEYDRLNDSVCPPFTGEYYLSSDTEVKIGKTYYELSGGSYIEVTPVGTENPSEEGWYELQTEIFYEIDMGAPQMIIGNKASFAVTVDNTQITFWYNWQKVAYINGQKMEIPESVMLNEMIIGHDNDTNTDLWSWREHDQNLQLKWVGV